MVIQNTHHSEDGRKLLVNVKIDDKNFTFVNIFAPHDDLKRTAFFERMKRFITLHSLQESDKYLCGDFNCSFERKHDKSHKKLAEIINYLDLVDIWKQKN